MGRQIGTWIENIPNNWDIKAIKNLITEDSSYLIDGDWIESKIITNSGVRYLNTGNIGYGYYKEQGNSYVSKDTFLGLGFLQVIPGDIMISRLNYPIARACIVPDFEDFYVVSVDNCILRPDKSFDKRFLVYAFSNDMFTQNANILSRGTTMKRVSRSILSSLKLIAPQLAQQQAIANFLDNKTKKIDELIKVQETAIERLTEYKQSVITEAVTKGLDPSVEMKDSNIEWIGEIPNNFTIDRMKNHVEFRTGTTPSTKISKYFDGDINWFTPSDFRKLYISNSTRKISKVALDELRIKQFRKGSSLIIGIGGTAGKVAYLEETGYSNQQITSIIPNKELEDKYLFYYLLTISKYIKDNALYTTLPIINNGYLSTLPIIIPLFSEQQSIIKYIYKKTDEISQLIQIKKDKIKKLNEYKKSLIYEAVTGKIEVM